MKAQELMIGDILEYMGTIVKVYSIGAKICVKECFGKNTYIVDFDNLLKGLELTPEILEKNGFKFYCTDVFEEWKSKDKRITIHDEEYPNSFNKWSIHVDTEDMRTMGYFEITYVHELQHALRFCGIDKEIEI